MPRIGDVLTRIGLALGAVATATLIFLIAWRLQIGALQRVGPFLFLAAVLASSWFGGYIGGIAAVLFATAISTLFSKGTINPTQFEPYRLALLLLLSSAVSWIEAHRRHVEQELRAGVEQKTAQLQAAIAHLEHEI